MTTVEFAPACTIARLGPGSDGFLAHLALSPASRPGTASLCDGPSHLDFLICPLERAPIISRSTMGEEADQQSRPLGKEAVIKGLGRITKSATGHQIVYTELVVEDENIDSIEILGSYPHLAHVQLARNKISDLSPLGGLPNLLTLDASENCLTAALTFKPSDNLQRVDLSHNQIRELSSLSEHRHITTLVLSHNKISSTAVLSNLKHLRYLDLSYNQLTSVDGLCGQPIQELHLSRNQVSTLDGVDSLKELQVITCSHNKLQRIDPLQHNHALHAIEARHNQLDLSPVSSRLPDGWWLL